MTYTIKDLLEKLIEIEDKMARLYFDISKSDVENLVSLKILAKVMGREEERHAIYFRQIINDICNKDDIEIDFFTYDKISQLVYQFKNKISYPDINNSKDLTNFIINFEKENLALLIDIRGRLVKGDKDVEKPSYKILSTLIDEEKKHVTNLMSL